VARSVVDGRLLSTRAFEKREDGHPGGGGDQLRAPEQLAQLGEQVEPWDGRGRSVSQRDSRRRRPDDAAAIAGVLVDEPIGMGPADEDTDAVLRP